MFELRVPPGCWIFDIEFCRLPPACCPLLPALCAMRYALCGLRLAPPDLKWSRGPCPSVPLSLCPCVPVVLWSCSPVVRPPLSLSHFLTFSLSHCPRLHASHSLLTKHLAPKTAVWYIRATTHHTNPDNKGAQYRRVPSLPRTLGKALGAMRYAWANNQIMSKSS